MTYMAHVLYIHGPLTNTTTPSASLNLVVFGGDGGGRREPRWDRRTNRTVDLKGTILTWVVPRIVFGCLWTFRFMETHIEPHDISFWLPNSMESCGP